MAIYRGSRYENTLVYNHVAQGEVHPTFQRNRTVPTLLRRTGKRIFSVQGVMHTWIQGDRLDSLAYKYYGDAQRWWVILDANPNYMTPWDIKPGDILSIPSYQEMRRSLGL